MNEESIRLFERFAQCFIRDSKAKYMRGAVEHEGDLLDMTPEQLLNEAIWENIDQAIYLYALREKLVHDRSTDDNSLNP